MVHTKPRLASINRENLFWLEDSLRVLIYFLAWVVSCSGEGNRKQLY